MNSFIGTEGKIEPWLEDIEGNNIAVNITEVLIRAKPVSIEIERGSETLAPQTVRIEMTRIQPDVQVGPTARESRSNSIVFGYKGHPTIPDTDIQKGDRFVADNIRFEVRLVFYGNPGMVQAWTEQLE